MATISTTGSQPGTSSRKPTLFASASGSGLGANCLLQSESATGADLSSLLRDWEGRTIFCKCDEISDIVEDDKGQVQGWFRVERQYGR